MDFIRGITFFLSNMFDWIRLLVYLAFATYCIYRVKQLSAGIHRTAMIVMAILWAMLTGWKLGTLILH